MIRHYKVFDGSTVEVFVAVATVADNPQFPMYWARPYIGQKRHVAVVKWKDHTSTFDNSDGTAIHKLEGGWYMHDHHRDLSVAESIEELELNQLPESEWVKFDRQRFLEGIAKHDAIHDEFYKDHPEFQRVQALRNMIRNPKGR